MEICAISDTISSIAYATHSLGFSNFLINHPNNVISLSDASSDQQQQSPLPFYISAASPPPTKTLNRRRVRNNRRIKRKIQIDSGGEGNGYFVFSDGGDYGNGGGYFGSGGGGGKGWNFGGNGGSNWEEFSDKSMSDPAFDFVYEVLCWIVMSSCLHYAFKRW